MSRVAVTGGAGKAGRAVVRDLLEHGYEVVSVDLVRDPQLDGQQLVADLTDYGEVIDALKGADAVVHLAAGRSRTRRCDRRFLDDERGGDLTVRVSRICEDSRTPLAAVAPRTSGGGVLSCAGGGRQTDRRPLA